MSDTYKFLKECGVFFVTTVNGMEPAARPFGAVMEYEEKLYISTCNEKEVYVQMKKNPKIQIVAWKHGTRNWIRVNADAVERNDLMIKRLMFTECPAIQNHYDTPECEKYVVFELQNVEAYLCNDQGKIRVDE